MENYQKDSWSRFYSASVKVLIGTLLLLICLTITYAWFTDSDNLTNRSDTGNVYVELHSDLSQIEQIAPNLRLSQNNLVYIQGKPTSADAYIRVSFNAYVGDYDITSYIRPILFNDATYILNGHDAWIYNDVDQKYYFVGYTNEEQIVTFCNGITVDQTLPKAFANKTVIFTISVDAIQRNYHAYETEPGWEDVYPKDWAEYLEKYDFEVEPEVPENTTP